MKVNEKACKARIVSLIEEVVKAREKEQEIKEKKKDLWSKFEEENRDFFEKCDLVLQQKVDAESELRRKTLEYYEATRDKKPVPGVGIRELTKWEYEEEKAFDWALEHKMALTLNKKAFEAIAKASALDFVIGRIEPQATIATKLEVVKEVS